MLPAIEKLLILQDRDQKILYVQDELTRIPHERAELTGKTSSAQTALDQAKLKVKQIESDRKKLELDVDAKKQLIEKYSLQQFQTKKNEEYRALAHEIETCKAAIVKLEDQQLELMEQGEAAQKVVVAATQRFNEVKRNLDARLADLAGLEKNLQAELAETETNRNELAAAVDENFRDRYERLLKSKGQGVVVVGIQHSVCGGCHMALNRQVVVQCQAAEDLVTCPNCGRILYFTTDMELAVTE